MSLYNYPNQRYTSQLGLSLYGMDEILAENFLLIDGTFSAGSTIFVNSALVTSPNFNGTTPAAPGGDTNVTFQVDINGNVSAYVPNGGTPPGGVSGDIQYNNAGAFGGSAATITAGGSITVPFGQSLLFPITRNAQVGITYTVLSTDQDKVVTFNSTTAVAVTLPQAGVAFPDGWSCYFENLNYGLVTITPTVSTVSSFPQIVLAQFQWARIVSDGTNYNAFFQKVSVQAAASALSGYLQTDAGSGASTNQVIIQDLSGLGINTKRKALNVYMENDCASGSPIDGLQVNVGATITANTNVNTTVEAAEFFVAASGSAKSITQINAVKARTTIAASTTVGNCCAFLAFLPQVFGTLSNYVGFELDSPVGGGTVTNWVGFDCLLNLNGITVTNAFAATLSGPSNASGASAALYLGDGTVNSGSIVWGSGIPTIHNGIYSGNGSPNSVVTANVGSMFLRQDGSTGTAMYIKETGAGNTGWTAFSAGFVNPMTTLGDLIYENVTPVAARLAGNITTTKMMLSQTGNGSISAAPVWAALVSGDIPNNGANTSGTAANLSGTPALPNGTAATTQALGDNSTKLATDAFVLANSLVNPMTTAGDIIYENSTPVPARLPIGTSGQILTVVAGIPAWVTSSGGTGTVTSVSFTGGLISVATSTTTPALTVSGTSGGIPYFSSTTTWASSALLASGGLVLGGGAGTAPQTSTQLTFSAPTLTVGLAGTSSGVLALTGSTSGSATFTAPAVAGTSTNPVLVSNSLQLATGNVLNWNADTGISRLGAASLALGTATAGDFTGSLKLSTLSIAKFSIATTGASQAIGFSANSDTYSTPVLIVQGTGNGNGAAGTNLTSTGVYSWAASTNADGSNNAGISRLGAASLAIGNGTAGDFSGTLKCATVNATSSYQANGTAGVTQTAIAVGTIATMEGIVTTFTAVSDDRLKTATPYAGGLAEVLSINPIRFTYNDLGQKFGGWDKEHVYVGFSAQNVQAAIPEAIQGTEGVEKYLSFDDRPVIAALVNAVKELTERLARLENKDNQ